MRRSFRLLLCFEQSRVDGVPAGVLFADAGAYRRGGGTALGLLAVTSCVGLATKAEQAPTVTASTDKQRMMLPAAESACRSVLRANTLELCLQ